MNKEIEIKQLTLADAELVIDLFDLYRIFYKQSSNLQLAADFIKERLSQNESTIFVALMKDGDKQVPVGFTQLYPTYSSMRATKNWILNDLYVKVDYRKLGIGESLIKSAMLFAKTNNAKFVQLETAYDNKIAQSLYERIGFRKQELEQEFFLYKIEVN